MRKRRSPGSGAAPGRGPLGSYRSTRLPAIWIPFGSHLVPFSLPLALLWHHLVHVWLPLGTRSFNFGLPGTRSARFGDMLVHFFGILITFYKLSWKKTNRHPIPQNTCRIIEGTFIEGTFPLRVVPAHLAQSGTALSFLHCLKRCQATCF